MISHRSIRKTYLCGILLDSSQYILFKYQYFRIFKNSQLKLFDFKICVGIYEKNKWKKNLKIERLVHIDDLNYLQ